MPFSAEYVRLSPILPCWQLHSIQISTVVANEVSLWVANIRMRPLPASCVFLIVCWCFCCSLGESWQEKQHITNLVSAWVSYWGKIIAVAVVLLMLAVRYSFKQEMYQFHSFYTLYLRVSLKNLRASYPGAVPYLNQKGLGIGKTKNKYLDISRIQVQVSILQGWLHVKDSTFFHFTKMCRGFYIYIYVYVYLSWYMCYLQWRLLREVHVQHLGILWGFTTSVLWSCNLYILMW